MYSKPSNYCNGESNNEAKQVIYVRFLTTVVFDMVYSITAMLKIAFDRERQRVYANQFLSYFHPK